MSYHFKTPVRYSEIGEDYLLTIPAILDYFQDCCTFQAESIGQGMMVLEERMRAWVLNSWQVVIRKRPSLGEMVDVVTLPYEFRGFLGMRNFLMLDENGERLAWANSTWSNVNTVTGHPERLTETDTKGYVLDEKLDMEYAPRKIDVSDPLREEKPFEVQHHHLDTHHHVNNCQYVKLAMGYLPEESTVSQLRVEYKKQALFGDMFYPLTARSGNRFWVIFAGNPENPLQSPYAVLEFCLQES